jgi:hypothetical protein
MYMIHDYSKTVFMSQFYNITTVGGKKVTVERVDDLDLLCALVKSALGVEDILIDEKEDLYQTKYVQLVGKIGKEHRHLTSNEDLQKCTSNHMTAFISSNSHTETIAKRRRVAAAKVVTEDVDMKIAETQVIEEASREFVPRIQFNPELIIAIINEDVDVLIKTLDLVPKYIPMLTEFVSVKQRCLIELREPEKAATFIELLLRHPPTLKYFEEHVIKNIGGEEAFRQSQQHDMVEQMAQNFSGMAIDQDAQPMEVDDHGGLNERDQRAIGEVAVMLGLTNDEATQIWLECNRNLDTVMARFFN